MATEPAPMIDPDSIVREVDVAAAPEIVFSYFVDPERLVRWMGAVATLDPRPGGLFRLEYANDQGVARGEFVAVDPQRRVVFTWGWEDPADPVRPGQTTVEVTIEPVGAGSRLVLRHSGLVGAARRSHEDGWAHFLSRLGEAVTA